MNRRPALFSDRDGTLIRDVHYLREPAKVELIPGAVEFLKRFRDAGFALVVVTNQSGIARGLITAEEYEAVRARLDGLLAAEGVTLDASLHCPHHPDHGRPCSCRKPGTLLFEQARDRLELDFSSSVLVGDRWRDVAPAITLGARGILVAGSETPHEDVEMARNAIDVVHRLADAARLALSGG
jgi:D-glycero-D-manno-heptose 1,7-bisphosphate phosphatase